MWEDANHRELVYLVLFQGLVVVEIRLVVIIRWIIIAWIVEQGTINLHVLNAVQRWKELVLKLLGSCLWKPHSDDGKLNYAMLNDGETISVGVCQNYQIWDEKTMRWKNRLGNLQSLLYEFIIKRINKLHFEVTSQTDKLWQVSSISIL